MDALTTVAEVQARSNGVITGPTDLALSGRLDSASTIVRAWCGWHIAPVAQVTQVRRRPWREQVWLDAMNILSIDAAQIDGYEYTAEELAAVVFDPGTGWTELCGANVSITFTCGYETVPEEIKALVSEMVIADTINPLGLAREQAGSVSYTLGRTGGGLSGDPTGGGDYARLWPYKIGRRP